MNEKRRCSALITEKSGRKKILIATNYPVREANFSRFLNVLEIVLSKFRDSAIPLPYVWTCSHIYIVLCMQIIDKYFYRF